MSQATLNPTVIAVYNAIELRRTCRVQGLKNALYEIQQAHREHSLLKANKNYRDKRSDREEIQALKQQIVVAVSKL